ncbi:MAG: penicillin acylase family protein, partial [Algiphilus sp.]
WIAQARANPTLLPAEYALLQTLPEPVTVTDVMAAGVLITRSVASAGGNEFDNVGALKALTAQHGTETARAIFKDVYWVDDRKAAVTIPLAEGTFSNITTPADQREAVFNAMADFALGLPDELAEGPGTGAAPVPALPDAVGDLNSDGLGTILARRVRQMFDVSGGASYMLAVTPERSANGRPLLFNGPQLGYSYPSQLMEIEVHGAGIDVRGATAPLLPVVGIGYGERTAFGVTTGNSKTIDSFIETLVEDNPKQYLHNGEVKDMECRMETVRYRQAQQGVPLGPDLFAVEAEVCRTVHGPVVARSEDGRFARTLNYAMWNREVDTINGVMKWGMVDSFDAFDAAMREVTWNENTMYVDADGTVAYYHPGLHPRRAPEGDQRFPLPGTGAFDHDGFMAFDQLPHVINPEQGYIANWNEKPAFGWGEGVGGNAQSLPAGPAHRVTNWTQQAAADGQISFEDILAFDKEAGIRDPRAVALLPILQKLRADATLSARQAALIDTVLGWDRNHYRVDIDIEDENATDTPGATVFDVFVRALIDALFADDLPDDLIDRMTAVGNHEYDAPPLLNLAIRILDPAQSTLQTRYDFTNGAGNDAILLAALDAADQRLQAQFGTTEITQYTRVHHRDEVCSLTGGIIGPCLTMPHQDRGSWNQAIGFE